MQAGRLDREIRGKRSTSRQGNKEKHVRKSADARAETDGEVGWCVSRTHAAARMSIHLLDSGLSISIPSHNYINLTV